MIAQRPDFVPSISEPIPDENGKINYHEHMVLSPHPSMAAPSVSAPLDGYVLARPGTIKHREGIAQGVPLLAALQLLVGYQWLVSGVDKLLDGTFPDHLGALVLAVSSGGNLPAFFATFLRQVVLPNSFAFGISVECGETLVGVGLITGGLLALVGPALRTSLSGTWARNVITTLSALTVVAAVMSLAMGANYYLLDGMPSAWFQPGFAVGGAIDSGLFLALGSLLILLGRATIRPGSRGS